MKFLHAFLLGSALGLCLPAAAQFQWIDHSGHHVFSDQPPPADIPEQNIISGLLPAVTLNAPTEEPAEADTVVEGEAGSSVKEAAAGAPAPDMAAAGVDPELERQRQEAEAAEQAQQQAEEARVAAERAENCRRAQESRRMLESGMRMARLNEKGERVIMDDGARAAEMQRANEIIAAECD